MRERRKESFLEEKLRMVGKALQQLKKDKKNKRFSANRTIQFRKESGS